MKIVLGLTVSVAMLIMVSVSAEPSRASILLDGVWDIAQGRMDGRPRSFGHRVPVPGLVDMATPPFQEVGKPSPRREAFWYRRRFVLNQEVSGAAWLKVHKARFGTRIWLNGQDLGEHLPGFTPGWFDVHRALRHGGEENELVIRVGADRQALPDGMPKGFDFEKKFYLAGLYDSVELILCDYPRIVNVQTVPDLEQSRVRVVAEIELGPDGHESVVEARVTEWESGLEVGRQLTERLRDRAPGITKVDLTLPIADCRLWSPEDPFLYRLHLKTGGDAVTVRFGMRTFAFDPQTKLPLLNGKPYYLRGSNVTLFRFFDDPEHGGLPWDSDWVRRLHSKFKAMHWNALRYCIGFPPEFWYEIADEEGFLIQDEFPVWLLGGQAIPGSLPEEAPDPIASDHLVREYTEWMRERWNHPCVVIWDGQNESATDETGKAIRAVRHLDLSNRPWENGWGEPQAATDCVESHPYLFNRGIYDTRLPFRMSQMPTVDRVPNLQSAQQKLDVPILVNEYAWLWLNRAGEPTTVTANIYARLLGPDASVAQRRELWARYLAAQTEFWRSHRRCVGVLHFCSLGYSRRGDIPQPEGGATSDHWENVAQLEWQPFFEGYVRDAFNPVGIMLDLWEEQLPTGARRTIPVRLVNDLDVAWHGEVRLSVESEGSVQHTQSKTASVDPFGDAELFFDVVLPSEPGPAWVRAELLRGGDPPVASRRLVNLIL